MTFTPAPRAKSNINKIKKPDLVNTLMMYQAELDKTKGELANANDKLENDKKAMFLLSQKVQTLQAEATLTNQIKKGWERHQVELPAFVNDVRKAVIYTVDSCKSISFLID
tara:strand:- start:83 stop:415 length:333 start_codon:yes stop_codon:yes gene_type:complete